MAKSTIQSGGCTDGSLGDGNVPYEDIEANHRGLIRCQTLEDIKQQQQAIKASEKEKLYKTALVYYVFSNFTKLFPCLFLYPEQVEWEVEDENIVDTLITVLNFSVGGIPYSYPIKAVGDWLDTQEPQIAAKRDASIYLEWCANIGKKVERLAYNKMKMEIGQRWGGIWRFEPIVTRDNIKEMFGQEIAQTFTTFLYWAVVNDTGLSVPPMAYVPDEVVDLEACLSPEGYPNDDCFSNFDFPKGWKELFGTEGYEEGLNMAWSLAFSYRNYKTGEREFISPKR